MEYEAGKLYWNGNVREYYICEKVDGDVVQFKSLRQNGYMDRTVGFVSDIEKDFWESQPEALDKRIDKIDQRVQDMQTDLVQEKKYLASLKGHRARRLKAEQEKLQAEETILKEITEGATVGTWWHGAPVINTRLVNKEEQNPYNVVDREAARIVASAVQQGGPWHTVGNPKDEVKVVVDSFTGQGSDTTQSYEIHVAIDSNATPQDIVDAISKKMIRNFSIECGGDGCEGCPDCTDDAVRDED